jgi:hypothetical protein
LEIFTLSTQPCSFFRDAVHGIMTVKAVDDGGDGIDEYCEDGIVKIISCSIRE